MPTKRFPMGRMAFLLGLAAFVLPQAAASQASAPQDASGGTNEHRPPAPGTVLCGPSAREQIGLLAALLPDVGAFAQAGAAETRGYLVGWALSAPFQTSRVARLLPLCEGQFDVSPHRAVLEPGFLWNPTATFYFRPGYRYIAHPRGSSLGIGAGLGATFELDPMHFGPSAELLVHMGSCCQKGHALVALRYDGFVEDLRSVVSLRVGYATW